MNISLISNILTIPSIFTHLNIQTFVPILRVVTKLFSVENSSSFLISEFCLIYAVIMLMLFAFWVLNNNCDVYFSVIIFLICQVQTTSLESIMYNRNIPNNDTYGWKCHNWSTLHVFIPIIVKIAATKHSSICFFCKDYQVNRLLHMVIIIKIFVIWPISATSSLQ